MIRTDCLTKKYNNIKVVDSINLKVNKGEICGFIGPNGAGKTTTIGMLVGLIEPTSGKSFINNIEVTKDPVGIKRLIGYLPDGVGFYPHLTGMQNLIYFSKFYGIKTNNANDIIKRLINYVGLADSERKPVGTYSRGMKQRLGLAKTLLNDPEVIFLDEPTSGLDPEGVVQFRNIIKDQVANNKTVFFSSHSLEEVHQVCNTICIISKGKIMAQGTLNEVRRSMSKNEYVTIIVKIHGNMPKLIDPKIIEVVYQDDTAIIKAVSDIREDIVTQLVKNNIPLKEIRLEEESLEELFLKTVYAVS
jgi:ABC-2 type transport system ATP-binding protein